MPRRLRLELARPGIADNGTPVPKDKLDEIVETWSDVGDAPIVLGHPPKSDRVPRFGSVLTVEKVNVRGGEVYASDVELHDDLADAYDAGHFTKWSIQAKPRPTDGKMQLYSLGFLGAVPPALKQLRVLEMDGVELSDGDDVVEIVLSDPLAPNPPDDPADPVATPKTDPKKNPAPPVDDVIEEVEEDVKKKNEQQAETAEQRAARLEREVAELKAGQARAEKREADQLVEQAEAAVEGQPLDVQEAAVELADQLAGLGTDDVLELSDGDKTTKASPAAAFVRFLKTLKAPVTPGVLELGDPPAPAKGEDDTPVSGRRMARSI